MHRKLLTRDTSRTSAPAVARLHLLFDGNPLSAEEYVGTAVRGQTDAIRDAIWCPFGAH
jgi:hypothetical protein